MRIGPSYELRFDPESSRAVSFGRNICLWSLNARQKLLRAHPLAHPAHVHWSPSGDLLSVKSTSGELIVVSAESLQIVARLQTRKAGEGCAAVFSPSGDRILDGTWGGMLATYDVATQSRQLEHSFPNAMITSIEPSPGGNISAIVVQSKDSAGLGPGPQHSIYIAEWSSSGLALRAIDMKFSRVTASAFNRNEDRLAIIRDNVAFPEGCIEIIDITHVDTIASRACILSPNGSSICWSPDGGVIGTVENDGFGFYDVEGLEEVAREPWKYAAHVEFSRDGKYLALGAWSGGEIRSADSVLHQASA
jgi:WD40 repeat protein